MMLMPFFLSLACNATEISQINPHQYAFSSITEPREFTTLEMPPSHARVQPDPRSISNELKNLSYSQAKELEMCLESFGPIDHNTPDLMISLIKKHKERAEEYNGIYSYMRGFVPAVDYNDLMVSFEDFLGRNMTSLRHKLPSTFSRTFKGFVDGYIKRKLVTRDSTINVILELCKTHKYDLDFAIGATNEYISWSQFYFIAAEYLGRRLSVISRLKRLLNRFMPKLAMLRKKLSSRGVANPEVH